jgi:hypothetical protein
MNLETHYAVTPRVIAFVGSPGKEIWIRENDRCGGLDELGFVQGPQKLDDEFEKTMHPGTIDRRFTVCEHLFLFKLQ